MGAEKKENQQSEQEKMLKSISSLLDETIAEIEELHKGEVSFKDLRLQPDENGDMAGKAGQSGSDVMKPLKKEDEESEETVAKEETVEEEEISKEIPPELSEAKDKKDKDKKDDEEEDNEEDEKAEKSESDPEYEKFKVFLRKALVDLGLAEEQSSEDQVAKSDEEKEETEDLEKSEETSDEDEELAKALEARDEKINKLTEEIKGLTETVEKISRVPQGRKSVSGLQPIRKSEEDADGGGEKQPLNKNEVLDKLLSAQQKGDTRVTPQLVAKYELTGDPKLVRDIMESK